MTEDINAVPDAIVEDTNNGNYDFKFNNGDLVRENISDVEGVIVCRTQWLTQCSTYMIQPKGVDKDGKPWKRIAVDENSLSLVVPEEIPNVATERGGPEHEIPMTNRL